MNLFFSTEGRIGRGKWWLGIILLLIIGIVFFAIFPTIALNPLYILIVSIIFLYPVSCLYLKRLQDRNKGHMPWLWIFIVPGFLYNLAAFLGIGFEQVEIIPGVQSASPTGIGVLLSLAAFVVGLWALVECGFLRGTKGDNDFGPDPVG